MGGSTFLRRRSIVWVAAVALAGAGAGAQAPAEVQGVTFTDDLTLAWTPTAGAEFHNVYRGSLSGLAAGVPARCHGHPVTGTSFVTPAVPAADEGYFFLVVGESTVGGEGSAGHDSLGVPRALLGSCGAVMRNHVLDRLGYGTNEWARDRIETLGSLAAYVDEQLDPDTISEADNADLNSRLAVFDPPADIVALIAREIISGVYARRQLQQQVGRFWLNHFNTYWRKTADIYQNVFPPCGVQPQCDPAYPQRAHLTASSLHHRELTRFQELAFKGSFRQILETSAKSPAMIIFLDTYANLAANPNENYSRELLELYSMGVDGGYTQADVEELARVFSGWTVCKKELANLDDPLAPCIQQYWNPTPVGDWTAHFRPPQHDCGQKILFAGTPQETVIPPTCDNPPGGAQDVAAALDAIVAHPSTPRFISRKILEQFVTDDPTEAMIDALVLEWNDAGNAYGVGDLREVLRAALTLGRFGDPDLAGSKVKTPFEHFISALRAIRGNTDGVTGVLSPYLINAQHLLYFNPVPTGYPEQGEEWLDTNNTLERQNFGIELAASSSPNFGSDPIGLLVAGGVSTAPGNAAAIVEFLAELLFGGALTPAERQAAIDFLNTDDLGNPAPYNNARIRELVGFLLGYPQFQEQ